MNVALLGFARQGRSSYEYWQKLGHDITICDKNPDISIPHDCSMQLGEYYLSDLDKFDLIVRTSSTHPQLIRAANPQTPHILDKVTTNTNEFFKVCPSKNIIGITGTKGKSTTSTLVTKMLQASGLRTHLGGNIGIPPLELLKADIKPTDWVVLELASFQIIDLQYSPHIAVVLMIDDEHLDWHGDLAEYLSAKQNLFTHQTDNDMAIYYADNSYSKKCADISVGKHIAYAAKSGAYVSDNMVYVQDTAICSVNDVALLGEHNIQNVLAAITVTWQITQNIEALTSVIKSFQGLPFRLEKRRTINEVEYYNDSFASNPRATIAAIKTINRPKILIVGGKDRGLNLTNLTDTISRSSSIKKVIVIGEAGPRLATELHKKDYTNIELTDAKSMNDIVLLAQSFAKSGDAVVLSPGFPSFDMFKDFEDRGVQFNNAVELL